MGNYLPHFGKHTDGSPYSIKQDYQNNNNNGQLLKSKQFSSKQKSSHKKRWRIKRKKQKLDNLPVESSIQSKSSNPAGLSPPAVKHSCSIDSLAMREFNEIYNELCNRTFHVMYPDADAAVRPAERLLDRISPALTPRFKHNHQKTKEESPTRRRYRKGRPLENLIINTDEERAFGRKHLSHIFEDDFEDIPFMDAEEYVDAYWNDRLDVAQPLKASTEDLFDIDDNDMSTPSSPVIMRSLKSLTSCDNVSVKDDSERRNSLNRFLACVWRV